MRQPGFTSWQRYAFSQSLHFIFYCLPGFFPGFLELYLIYHLINKIYIMKRSSTAIWHGTGKEGSGKIVTQSQALDHVAYSWKTRFTEEKGTNPEELIAAAHASCYTMKLSFLLTDAGHHPEVIRTNCTITMEDGKINGSNLDVRAKVQGITGAKFEELAQKAKETCPVSMALSIPVSITAVIIDEMVGEATS
jgi:lipoyl-dependent peroxiredoxin